MYLNGYFQSNYDLDSDTLVHTNQRKDLRFGIYYMISVSFQKL